MGAAGVINTPDIFWMREEVAEMGEGSKGMRECGRRAWRLAGLSSALAFPLDLGALSYLVRNPALAQQSRKPTRRHRHLEMRAFFSCMAWLGAP